MIPEKPSLLNRLRTWISNARYFHERVMARFLASREWVVFYLPEDYRKCTDDSCWLRLYESERDS